MIAPLAMAAYAIGLPFGPGGVAFAFSTAMALWFIPHAMWCLRDTTITLNDLVQAAVRPFIAAVGAGGLAYGSQWCWPEPSSPLFRLLIGTAIMMSAYAAILVLVLGQRQLYGRLLWPAQAIVKG
jgi:PST family polysaccharide transporter